MNAIGVVRGFVGGAGRRLIVWLRSLVRADWGARSFAAHGLSAHTLDAWRRRIAGTGSDEKIVPVEIVEDRRARMGSTRSGSTERSGQFRVVLADGLRIEIDPGFDAAELQRLIAALDSVSLRNGLRQPA